MTSSQAIDEALESLAAGATGRLVTARLEIPARRPRTAPLPATLGEGARRALAHLGIAELYSHQLEAFELLADGRDVVVSTPTASGKSLCYALPVLDSLSRDPGATALLLFPTKALSRDQGKALTTLLRHADLPVQVAAYDGDTNPDARRRARGRARVVLTNPDMLHMGILPHHTMWAAFLSGLSYVVIDELHQYRGVFGSHFANVLRRLDRVLGFYGSRPRTVCSSATIANPDALAAALAGRPFELVSGSGAPAGHRTVLFMTPPLVDPGGGVRGSYLHLSARIAAELADRGLQTLVFAQSRRSVEMLLGYVRDRVRAAGMEPERVQGYRGGYLPRMRRRIEDGLKAGELRCVVATNALELGVDVGSLDAVVLAGYPGSVASTWQRIGRAGRRSAPSLAVIVGSASPLDQYMISHADWLADASPEKGLVNPDNLDIVLEHVRCATFELPFEHGERFGGLPGDEVAEILAHLAREGLVHRTGTVHAWVADEYPGSAVNLRSVGPEPFVVLDETLGEVLGEVDGRSAHRMLHEQAIYQHGGLPYLVERLDLTHRRAHVRQVDPQYTTRPVVSATITPVEHVDARESGRLHAHLGEVRIVERVTGFTRIRYGTHENLGHGEVDLPEMAMEAFAVWIQLDEQAIASGTERLAERLASSDALLAPLGTSHGSLVVPAWLVEALGGLGHLLRHIASLRLMCDPHDVVPAVGAGTLGYGGETAGDVPMLPALYIHESQPGGVGLVERLYDDIPEVCADALDALMRCPCDNGCPSCVGPPDRDDVLKKRGCTLLLELGAGHVH